MNYCWVIPHFNHSAEFVRFLPRILDTNLTCIVADDGSDPQQLAALEDALKDKPDIHLIKHAVNRGKGAAVMSACHYAHTLGMTHIIQIDADGQHEPRDCRAFIDASRAEPDAIISGYPVFDDSVPAVRKYGRRVTTFFVALETLSFQIKDALCGYRVYPLRSMDILIDNYHIGVHMDFDTDALVKAVWAGIPIKFIDTPVRYEPDGISHFHYLKDNQRLIGLHTRLLIQAVINVPKMLVRRLRLK